MSDEIKKIDEISETQNAPEIKKEKKKLSKKAKKNNYYCCIGYCISSRCGCCRRRVCAQFILQNEGLYGGCNSR